MRVPFCALLVVASCSIAAAITNIPGSGFDVKRVIPQNQMQAITFTPNGDLYMCLGSTKSYCKYPNAVNLPIGATLSAANATCGTGNGTSINFISTRTGRIYDTFGYEIDKDTWVSYPRWKNCGATHGIGVDPRDGAIFVSNNGVPGVGGKIWRIPNPDTNPGYYDTDCVNDLYFDLFTTGTPGAFDALTVGPDGTIYAAGTGNFLVVVSAYSTSSPKGTLIKAKPSVGTVPDGISICVDSGNSFALVAMNTGTISRFNLTGPGGTNYAETKIADSVGGYLDFTAVDPKGCIWGTTIFAGGQGTYRVTNADGTCGCASPQVTPPSNPSCPDCSDVNHVTYTGSTTFSASFHSSGLCSSITFD